MLAWVVLRCITRSVCVCLCFFPTDLIFTLGCCFLFMAVDDRKKRWLNATTAAHLSEDHMRKSLTGPIHTAFFFKHQQINSRSVKKSMFESCQNKALPFCAWHPVCVWMSSRRLVCVAEVYISPKPAFLCSAWIRSKQTWLHLQDQAHIRSKTVLLLLKYWYNYHPEPAKGKIGTFVCFQANLCLCLGFPLMQNLSSVSQV